jgi:NAD(P)-dependent dehydrogenase (short-subunit alcohol dehydrogenase family)
MGELDGKVAIITGGAGALGGAVVSLLLSSGAAVFVPYQRAGELETLRQRSNIPETAKLSGAALDLTDEDAIVQTYTAAADQLGGLDILVNIAGGFDGGNPVHETAWSLWQQQLDVNLKTAVLSCKAAIPHMLMRGGGAIVNVSSRTAVQSGAYVAAYSVAKRSVIGLTEALAAELRDRDITVNAVMPSVIDTSANRASNPNADYSAWVKPHEIAQVIRFLVGPNARVISGASLPVYGKA